MQPRDPLAKIRSRQLRNEMPKTERLLWWKLREANRMGFHFRRQVPIRGYFADFAEQGSKVVTELDGSQHGADATIARDAVRDRAMAEDGYCILRFPNDEVLRDLDGVVESILRSVKQRRPPTRRFASTSPQGGGSL
jgi:very-short-patch-repair endonuclease